MNIPILKYVDVVVGFSLIMVLISTIVLAITQTILNSTSARTRHLQRSLVRLLRQIQPGPLAAHAPYLAALIVRHPMIGRQTMGSLPRKWVRKLRTRLARRVSAPAVLRTPAAPPAVVVTSEKKSKPGEIKVETSPPESYGAWVRRVSARAAQKLVGSPDVLPPVVPGSVIQRDELAYILVELAAGEGPLMDPLDDGVVPESVAQAQKVLASALRVNGIEDPVATLRAVRIKALANERAHPEQPAQQWRTAAVVDTAPSDFVGKIHHTFDQVMARSTDGFGVESQIVVTVVALIVAVAMQLDSLVILKRLSLDEGMRQALVEAAKGTETAPDVAKARESLALLNSPSIDLFSNPAPPLGLPAVPATIPETLTWPLRGLSSVAAWVMANGFKGGVLLSWLLLSLGAPFWFDMLKNALRLRSILAVKDEADRQARSNATPTATTSTTTTTSTATAPTSPARTAGAAAPADGDEAGDLSATGAQG